MKIAYFPLLCTLAVVLGGCSQVPVVEPDPAPDPRVPVWTFSPVPRGVWEGRVAILASAGGSRPVYFSVGGDPRTEGTLQTSALWLGERGAWSLNWSTPTESEWDPVRSTTYQVLPDRPQAAAGADHALVIDSTVLWARGHGTNGQLGQGEFKPATQTEWLQVNHSEAVLAVWAAGDNTLFLDEKGDLWFCGYGSWLDGEAGYLGQIGTPVRVPLPPGTRAVTAAISAWGGVWAVDQDGSLWVWGDNRMGTFGVGEGKAEVRTAVQVPGVSHVAVVSAAPYHALVLQSDGKVLASGLHHGIGFGGPDTFNRLGTGSDADDHPAWVSLGTWSDALSLGASDDHSWLLTQDGDLWMWGSNGFGQLSDQTDAPGRLDVPTKVAARIALVSSGTRFTLVAPETGPLVAWGEAPGPLPALRADEGLRSLHGGTAFGLVLRAGFHDGSPDPWPGLAVWGDFYH